MATEEKKGITVKVDADLHAEVRRNLEQNGMTMGEFVAIALHNELHPKNNQKEDTQMGNMRTLAFQVPEELFQKLKDYLTRHGISQKQFVIGLIEKEIDRDFNELNSQTASETDDQLFLVKGGNGARPNGIGRKVFGEFLKDGEPTNFFRDEIIGVLRDEHLLAWAEEKLQDMSEEAPTLTMQ